MTTGILDRLSGITRQQEGDTQRLRATAQEALEQMVFGTEPANLEGLLEECGVSPEAMTEAVKLIHRRQADALVMVDAESAQQERAALAIEEQEDITRRDAQLMEFNSRQLIRNARAQAIEGRVAEAAQARKRLAQTYRDPEIDATLTRCHARMREVVDGMRQLQDQINLRTAKLKQSQASKAPDAAEAVAISERMLEEYRETMLLLTAEKQDLSGEISAAELAKLDAMAVKI